MDRPVPFRFLHTTRFVRTRWEGCDGHSGRMGTDLRTTPHRRQYDRDDFEGREAKTGLTHPGRMHGVPRLPGRGVGGVVYQHGERPTPIISDIMAMDGTFEGSSPVLHHCNGDFCNEQGYSLRETPLGKGASSQLCPQRRASVRPSVPVLPRRVQGLWLVHRYRLAGPVVGHFHWACRRRARPGRPGEDPSAVDAGRNDPHSANDRDVLDRRCVAGDESLAPLVSGRHSAAAEWPAPRAAAGRLRNRRR